MSSFESEPSKWTKDNCFIKAQDCQSRGDFKKKYPNAYGAALDNAWLDELFANHPNHGYKNKRVMIGMESHQGKIYWTEERVLKEAHKYHSLSEFAKKCSGAYDAAFNLQIMDMVRKILAPNFMRWTYDMIKDEAIKYKTRRDFHKGSIKAYNAAYKRGLLDDICSHMKD